jgi:hypothetical protein
MANSIQKLVFKGLIGNMPWAKMTVNEFINALEENGWREAHNGHIYQRLKERGPRLGIKTPNDLARALSRSKPEPADAGAMQCVFHASGGDSCLVFRGTSLITFRDIDE